MAVTPVTLWEIRTSNSEYYRYIEDPDSIVKAFAEAMEEDELIAMINGDGDTYLVNPRQIVTAREIVGKYQWRDNPDTGKRSLYTI